MFDDYVAGLGNQLDGQPEVEAELRNAFGCSYLMLGVPDQAAPHFQRAIDLRRKLPGPQTVGLAESLAIYGMNLYLQRRYVEAEPPLREALEIFHQRNVVTSGAPCLSACAVRCSWSWQRPVGTTTQNEQSTTPGPRCKATTIFRQNMPNLLTLMSLVPALGVHVEAAEFLRRATLAQQRLRNSFESLGALQLLAITQLRLGDSAGYRKSCAMLCVAPPRAAHIDSPYFPYEEFNLGRIWTCCLGPDAVDDPSIFVAQAEEFAANNKLSAPFVDTNLLGATHYRAGNFEKAEKYFEQSIAQYPSDAPPSHGTVLWPQLYLAMTKWQQGEHDIARKLLHEIQPGIGKALDTPMLLGQYRQITEVLCREAAAMIIPTDSDEAVENLKQQTLPPTNDN
jgi:tetratricopeptide (TPR) repeat protein